MAKSTKSASSHLGGSKGALLTERLKVVELEKVGQSPIEGPIFVDCYDTTIVVPPDCTVATGDWGNVVINIESEVI